MDVLTVLTIGVILKFYFWNNSHVLFWSGEKFRNIFEQRIIDKENANIQITQWLSMDQRFILYLLLLLTEYTIVPIIKLERILLLEHWFDTEDYAISQVC